jgi:hypothetical protein
MEPIMIKLALLAYVTAATILIGAVGLGLLFSGVYSIWSA